MKTRVTYLDGLRGIAIVSVLLYHLIARWPEYINFNFFGESIFNYGWLGVQLFFMISGFVISMTLERSENIKLFFINRWIRLFPAMFIATVIIYFSSFILDFRPAGKPSIWDLLPGLTFISHEIYNLFFSFSINSLEGVFWSLYVEVIFYVIISFLYFKVDKDNIVNILLSIFILSLFIKLIASTIYPNNIYYIPFVKLGFTYYGWFIIGIISFKFTLNENECKEKYHKQFLVSVFLSIGSIRGSDLVVKVAAIITLLLFVLPIFYEKINVFFSNSFFVFFGTISYPLYLIHENMMISLVRLAQLEYYGNTLYLLVICILTFLVFISWCITFFIEPRVKKFLKGII